MDLHYSLRLLKKNPGFAAVAVLSLALGIGANTAIFSLINALLLRELPVRQPERLVELYVVRRSEKITFSFPMFQEIERGQKAFSGVIGWSFGEMVNVEVKGVLSQARVRAVSGNYYSELGASPLIGRLIMPDDDVNRGASAASSVAVLSYDYWQRRFGGASNVVGQEIAIDAHPMTIIGVSRKWFVGMSTGEPADVTIPIAAGVAHPGVEDRSKLWVFVTGRLKDGVTIDQARAQLQSFWPALLRATASTETPGLRRQTFLSMGLNVAPVATGIARDLRAEFTKPLYLLMGIVGLILLIACVNLANLMLARAAARQHEMSVRLALGASRWALARQIFIESLALSTCGGVLGFSFAYWGGYLLVSLMTEGSITPITLDLRPDWRVFSLTASVAFLTGILFGLAPAWRASRQDPGSALQQNARSATALPGKLGKSLLVTQVGLSLTLLLGAGLLVRAFQRLRLVDPEIEESVFEVSLYPRPGGYQNLNLNSYHRQLIERVSGVPGVLAAGFSDIPLPTSAGWQDAVLTMSTAPTAGAGVMASIATVSPGFFRTLGINLVRGRNFEATDDEQHPRVAIVSSSLAEGLLPPRGVIGERVRIGFMPEFQDIEVVGIAGNSRLFDLRNPKALVIYVPYLQYPAFAQAGNLFVRAKLSSETLARTVAQQLDSFGHEYALSTKTIRQEISAALVENRVIALLSSFFAALALLLVSIGLYGLMSYTVARRTREIGIRAALGAQRSKVLWLILREGLALGLFGIAVGVPCALAATRLIASMLFATSPTDLPTIILVSLLLLSVTLIAGYVPARRASRVDPMVALRYE